MTWLATSLLAPTLLHADGGQLVLNQIAGPFRIAVFTEPTPPRVGPIEVSVLLQDSRKGSPVLDAEISVQLAHAAGGATLSAPVPRGHAQNRLLYATRLDPTQPGPCELSLEVRRGAVHGTVVAPIRIEPAGSAYAEAWPYLAIPPLAIALFALHQRLKRRRPA